MDVASFYDWDLKNTVFQSCSLREVDFAQCNLSEVQFEACDLSAAIFDQSNLEKADFRTAYHFRIDPEQNQMLGAKFATHNLAGLLSKYQLEIE